MKNLCVFWRLALLLCALCSLIYNVPIANAAAAPHWHLPPPDGNPQPLPPLSELDRVLATEPNGSTQQISIRAYLHQGVSETAYRDFVTQLTAFYRSRGFDLRFKVNELFLLGAGESCGWSRGSSHVITCVGSGMHGYYGPPWYRVGINTDYPFGLDTNWGLQVTAHEFGHFFAVQDLYWLKSTADSHQQAPGWTYPNDLMFDPYVASPMFSPESEAIIQHNLERLGQQGNEGLVLVSDRMVDKITVMTPQSGDRCDMYGRSRDLTAYSSHLDETATLTRYTNAQKILTFPTFASDSNVDDNFDFYLLDCQSGRYWVHSHLIDGSYFTFNQPQVPGLLCLRHDAWCQVPDPGTVAFAPSQTSGNAPLLVSFANQSSGHLFNPRWEFESETSSKANPSHTFQTPGSYEATLSFTELGSGETMALSQTITVYEAASVSLSATPLTGEAPLTVDFTSELSGDYNGRLWTFGDGGSSTKRHPSHTFTEPGSYTVVLSAVETGTNEVLSQEVVITVTPPEPDEPIDPIEPEITEYIYYLPVVKNGR